MDSSLPPRPGHWMEHIGFVRCELREKMMAPRQGTLRDAVAGRIELLPDRNFEHALLDLDSFSHVWVLFLFHQSSGYRPKVLPPRGSEKRGVFATRSPHRPNPIGMTLVELGSVEGLTLHVRGLDLLDGTPVIDLKPYLPYADFRSGAGQGWLDRLNEPSVAESLHRVEFAARAREQLDFLKTEFGIDLEPSIRHILERGPEPRPYRRIKRDGDGFRLALWDYRIRFGLVGETVSVESVDTGYRPRHLATVDDAALDAHRALSARFPR